MHRAPTARPPIAGWNDFADAIGPHLTADNPLASLAASGVQLAGEVGAALSDAAHLHPPGELLMASLRQDYEVVPASLSIGRRRRQEPPPTKTTGFAFVATADLAVANDALAELYRVGTIPHELSDGLTAQLANLDLLRETCAGVPDDAKLGRLRVTQAPTVAASSVTQRQIRIALPFALPLAGSQPASLSGVLRLEVPLEFNVSEANVTPFSRGVTAGTLEIASASTVRPLSEQARRRLEQRFVSGAASAFPLLTQGEHAPLRFSVSIPVGKARFPNSTIDITQLAAVTIRQSGRDYLVAGLNVEHVREVDPIKLIGQLAPAGASNIRAVVDEQFASDALSSAIASGDLAAFINRVVHRHAHGLAVNEVVVDDGRVAFTDGRLEVTLDCVWRRGCIAGTDLAFTASLYGWPAVVDGKLRLTGSTIEFDMDDIDAVVCLVTSALGGPWTVVMYAVILGYLEASDPNSSTLDIPVSEASDPLPGSDKVVSLELASAVMEPDVLTGEGTLALIEDPLRIYAYLRVVERGAPGGAQPVSNAEVTLHEIDYPPPAGDDVIDPSGYTEISTPRLEITEETIYNPKADELLGTATTGDDGRVTFVVISDMLGGSATTTRVTENRHTGQTSVIVTNWLVGEALPDLAVSVRAANGTLLAQERLIALNVEHRRFGRFDHPVDVVVQAPVIDPHPVPPPPPNTTTVPDVLELGRAAAVALIGAAGLIAEPHGATGPNAWVRSQHPSAGAVVAIGSAVSLTLSTSPRP
jgi:hypothetical protein